MKYHALFFQKVGKMSQNLSSAAVVIVALRVKDDLNIILFSAHPYWSGVTFSADLFGDITKMTIKKPSI